MDTPSADDCQQVSSRTQPAVPLSRTSSIHTLLPSSFHFTTTHDAIETSHFVRSDNPPPCTNTDGAVLYKCEARRADSQHRSKHACSFHCACGSGDFFVSPVAEVAPAGASANSCTSASLHLPAESPKNTSNTPEDGTRRPKREFIGRIWEG